MRKLLPLVCLGLLFVACGDDSSSSPDLQESSSSEIIETSSSVKRSSSSVPSSSSAKSSSSQARTSSYVEKHLAWDYLNPALSYGEFTDERDGRIYKYVECGGFLRFMAENLNYVDSIANPNLLGSSWCPYNDLDSCSKYGRLYTWAAAMNAEPKYNYEDFAGKSRDYDIEYQGLCPDGWLMYANNLIWNEYVYRDFDPVDYCAQEGWRYEGCTNELGFTALPGGYYEDGEFKEVGENFYYWSVQGGNKDMGGLGTLSSRLGTVDVVFRRTINFMEKKSLGAAVRCYQLIPQDP